MTPAAPTIRGVVQHYSFSTSASAASCWWTFHHNVTMTRAQITSGRQNERKSGNATLTMDWFGASKALRGGKATVLTRSLRLWLNYGQRVCDAKRAAAHRGGRTKSAACLLTSTSYKVLFQALQKSSNSLFLVGSMYETACNMYLDSMRGFGNGNCSEMKLYSGLMHDEWGLLLYSDLHFKYEIQTLQI